MGRGSVRQMGGWEGCQVGEGGGSADKEGGGSADEEEGGRGRPVCSVCMGAKE